MMSVLASSNARKRTAAASIEAWPEPRLPSLERSTNSFISQVAQVLDAVAADAVAPDVGRLIIDSIKSLADVRASEELAARIEALEEARDARR